MTWASSPALSFPGPWLMQSETPVHSWDVYERGQPLGVLVQAMSST